MVEAVDLEQAHQILISVYANMRIAATGERQWMRLTSATLGVMRFDRIGFRMAMQADVEPLHCYVFGQLDSGHLRYSSAGEDRDQLPGDAFLHAQPCDAYHAALDDAAVALVVINQPVIDQVAGGPVTFTGYRPVSPQAAQGWKSTCAMLRDEVLTNFTGDHLVASSAARLFAAVTLATFPNTAQTDPTPTDRHDAHPRTLRRAVAFIEANAHQDISATDIARAARVTVRALQLTFRRHLDTTPMRYLRRVRLDCARAQLASAAPGDTVTAIAARWGYARPSVFAAHYRAAYGQSPSQTLRDR